MYKYSEGNDFNSILTRLLANVDDTLDKREGSIIYDALAPAAVELANCYVALDIYAEQTNVSTATGENLDNRAADYGLTRIPATKAEVTICTYDGNNTLMDVDIGSRFASPNEYGGLNYTITERISAGTYTAECETEGSDGNSYIGMVLPLQGINNLGNAEITAVSKPGEDTEEDETFRKRIIARLSEEPFAGNKSAYRQMAIGIDGVEDCKVFPVWAGGGTVKLAIISTDHTLPSSSFVNEVQTMIDPIANSGEGRGLAPIGHSVTVISPTSQALTINATLVIDTQYDITTLRPAILKELHDYIYEVQNRFADDDKLIVYHSKVIAAILNVSQVKSVSALTINGSATDYEIDNSVPAQGTHIVKYPTLDDEDVTLST